MEVLIKKVKVLPRQKKIKIDYEKAGDKFSGTYSEPAEPEFYQSFQKLILPVCEICELDLETFSDRIVPYGVTFAYVGTHDTMKASIQCKMHMPLSNTDTVLNTPSRTVSTEFEDGLDADTCRIIEKLEQETRKYLNGQRAQQSLFEQDVTPRMTAIEG